MLDGRWYGLGPGETSDAGECKVGHNRGVGNIEGLKAVEGDMGKFCIRE
jgi:hypothetical protein